MSDHTLGIAVPVGAAARGAAVIEKHFTLDKNLSGPDHEASRDPAQLQSMVKGIRDIEVALGRSLKARSGAEWNNRSIVRKSLVAKQSIKKGDLFTPENLTAKRPRNGLSPMKYWCKINSRSNHDYSKDQQIK